MPLPSATVPSVLYIYIGTTTSRVRMSSWVFWLWPGTQFAHRDRHYRLANFRASKHGSSQCARFWGHTQTAVSCRGVFLVLSGTKQIMHSRKNAQVLSISKGTRGNWAGQKKAACLFGFFVLYVQVPLSFFLPGQDIYLGAAWLFVGVLCALWVLTTQVSPRGQENRLQMWQWRTLHLSLSCHFAASSQSAPTCLVSPIGARNNGSSTVRALFLCLTWWSLIVRLRLTNIIKHHFDQARCDMRESYWRVQHRPTKKNNI